MADLHTYHYLYMKKLSCNNPNLLFQDARLQSALTHANTVPPTHQLIQSQIRHTSSNRSTAVDHQQITLFDLAIKAKRQKTNYRYRKELNV